MKPTDLDPAMTLKKAREAAGLSQSELARRTGVKAGHISDIEGGKKPNVPWQKLQALLAECRVALSDAEAGS